MDIRRHIMGLSGIAFLLGGVGLLYTRDSGQMSGIGIKVGLVLCAIWLAFPQVDGLTKRIPPWLMGSILIALLVIAIRPRYALFIAPLLAAIAALQFIGWLFKPLPNPKRKRQAKSASKND